MMGSVVWAASTPGSAAGICGAWRNAGIFQLAFPGVDCTNPATEAILRTVDAEIRNSRPFHDPTLIGSLFLVRFFDLLRSMTDGVARIDNVEFINRLAAVLEPTTTSLHLSNHSVHLLHHGLFTMTKLRLPPERGRQVLKLSRQEFFPVAWGLYSLAAKAGLQDNEVYSAWSRALDRVRRGTLDEAVADTRSHRPRRRRRRRR